MTTSHETSSWSQEEARGVRRSGGRIQRTRRVLSVATWNVPSLVEDSCDERICRKRPRPSSTSVDRKFDFLVHELHRYGVAIAAVQDTKWFGTDVWTTKGYTLLHSGRGLPTGEAVVHCNEGVGILLDPALTQAWR